VACCKNQRVILGPEDEDWFYIVVPTRKGNDGPVEFMLAHHANGDCYYLTDNGCAIWDRAPFACREFDCRKWWNGFDERQKIAVMRGGLPDDMACASAAMDRL
jgi:hypothetical protein